MEFANVILLNKCDVLTIEERSILSLLLHSLNPAAVIHATTNSVLDLTHILNTKLFSMAVAAENPNWLKEARLNEHTPETFEYGISNFTYRSKLPIHPERLFAAMQNKMRASTALRTVLRSKGFLWLATRKDNQCIFSLAGGSVQVSCPTPL